MTTQSIVTRLITAIDRNSVETHINMCIATRRAYGDNATDAMLGVLTYLAHNLGHRLHADEAVMLAESVMKLDSGVTSIQL